MRDLVRGSHGWPVAALMALALVSFLPGAHAQGNPIDVTTMTVGDAIPGGTVTITATIAINDGSTLQSVAWSQVGGAPAVLSGIDTVAVTAVLASTADYRDHLIMVLSEPPGGQELEEFSGGLQDRFVVVGMSPYALEEAALVALQLDVVTSSGTYPVEVDLHTALPWKPASGISTVGVGLPVQLHGKTQDTYDWALTAPSGSAATLTDATGQNPYFTPDVAGHYELTVTDLAAAASTTVDVYAGTWQGVIVGQDADGLPVADPGCRGCHSGASAADAFTPWAASGHAHIFSTQLTPAPTTARAASPATRWVSTPTSPTAASTTPPTTRRSSTPGC